MGKKKKLGHLIGEKEKKTLGGSTQKKKHTHTHKRDFLNLTKISQKQKTLAYVIMIE
jgi:hypothetical protein